MSTWTDAEETAFKEIMQAGDLERMPAIRLYRRFKGNLSRALQIAKTVRGGATDAQRAARTGNLARAHAATRQKALSSDVERACERRAQTGSGPA